VSNASYRRPCPRTLDRPILVFGLEPEDLLWVGLGAGALLFLVDPIVAVGAGAIAWVALLRLKAGRPPGHLFYLAYRGGVLRVLPPHLRPTHLLPPGRRRLRLDPFEGDERDECAQGWWRDRRRL
jgi:type IV secretory pathway TrbD component